MEHILAPTKPLLMFYEDNNATIRIVEIGKSQNLRHVKRLHDLSLEWFHDCHKQKIFSLKYCPSHLQAADMMTKITHDPQTWRSLLRLVCLFPMTNEPPDFSVYDGIGNTGRGDQIDEQGNITNAPKKLKRVRA